MDAVTIGGVKQNIFPVSVAKSQDVASNTHHGRGTCIGQAGIVPRSNKYYWYIIMYRYVT